MTHGPVSPDPGRDDDPARRSGEPGEPGEPEDLWSMGRRPGSPHSGESERLARLAPTLLPRPVRMTGRQERRRPPRKSVASSLSAPAGSTGLPAAVLLACSGADGR